MCRKCGNMGHVERICKSKSEEAMVVAEEREDEQLFVATCFASRNSSSDSWLIDSGCTYHMTNDLNPKHLTINKVSPKPLTLQ